MSKYAHLRAIDQSSFIGKNRTDFKRRRHNPGVNQLVSLAFTLVVIVASVIYLVQNNMMSGAMACLITGVLLFTIGKYIESLKQALETTEFLNALFSSTLADGYKFCSIVKQKDGKIVYSNNGFQKLFPEMLNSEHRHLEMLFENYKLAENKHEPILQAVSKAASKEIPITIGTGKDKKRTAMTVSIQPIARPSGFCLVRGS